jgi:hypothetical protein
MDTRQGGRSAPVTIAITAPFLGPWSRSVVGPCSWEEGTLPDFSAVLDHFACSFCGVSARERRIITGPRVHVCAECATAMLARLDALHPKSGSGQRSGDLQPASESRWCSFCSAPDFLALFGPDAGPLICERCLELARTYLAAE